MIHLTMEQGTQEWLDARMGVVTASAMAKIITPATGKISKQARKYAFQLVYEQAGGIPAEGASNAFMQRGSLMEHQAVAWYEFERGVDTGKVGFVMRDDRRVGCSPDRLVGANGLLEIKVPSGPVHLQYLSGDESVMEEYRCQCQGQLWVTEREWIDTLSYSPLFQKALRRHTRDETFIGQMAQAVEQFLNMVDEIKVSLQPFGMFADFQVPDLRVVA